MATGTKPKQASGLLARIPVAEILARLGVDVSKGRLIAGGEGDKVRFPCPYHKGDGNNLEMRLTASADRKYKAGEHTCYVCGTTGTEGGAGGKAKRADFAKFYAHMTGTTRALALAELEKQYGGGAEMQPEVDRTLVGAWHNILIKNDVLLDKLLTRKGITRDTIARREIGYDSENNRYTIPVFDPAGRTVNVRRYLLDRVAGGRDGKPLPKMINMQGHGSFLTLYPIDNFTRPSVEFDRSQLKEQARELISANDALDEPMILMEGEVKALLLEQHGFRGIAGTGGADSWSTALTAQFKDRQVYVCYDIDKAGRTAAERICKQLRTVVKWVGNVVLPLELEKGHKDITHYFMEAGYTGQDFANLLMTTNEYTPQGRRNIDEEYNGPPLQTTLRNAVKAQYSGKRLETEFLVATKDTSPFLVPNKIKVLCAKDAGTPCEGCSVMLQSKGDVSAEISFDLADADPATLRLLNTRHDLQAKVLREIFGIANCNKHEIEPVKTENVEFAKLVPAIDISNPELAQEDCSREGYRIGFGLEPNTGYKGTGFVMPDPANQIAVLMFTGVEPAVDSLAEFDLHVTEAELADLVAFQPADQNDTDSIADKIDSLYHDLSMNVTGIYDRPDMHLFMDLAWHSLCYLPGDPFHKKEPERGWCDMLVIGDTRQGKTETAARLRSHYGLGSWAPAKICTRAGLIGAAQHVGQRWHISWGMVPSADRQLVVIEEAKGMPKDVIKQMTDVRSSGKAMIIMVETATTHARTRLLWLSNPRSDRSMNTYPYGVEAVKELVGAQEDISRFTAVMSVASGEVDEKTLAGDQGGRVAPPHWATSARCRRLILWAWTRTSDKVEFSKETVLAIRDVVRAHSAKYSPSLPLVEPADHRFKIARLAAALAARLFSTDAETRRKVIVTPAHVHFIGNFLDQLYSNPHFAYDQWSKFERAGDYIKDPQRVQHALMTASERWGDACQSLLSLAEVGTMDLEDLFGVDKDTARKLMSTLTQSQCVRRKKNARYRTPAFNHLLKEMLAAHAAGTAIVPDLPGVTPVDKAGDDDF